MEPGKLTTSFRAPERHISQPPADGFVGSKGCVICLGVQERPKEYLHFTLEPVDRGARKAGKRRKFERVRKAPKSDNKWVLGVLKPLHITIHKQKSVRKITLEAISPSLSRSQLAI